jgi:hypothetical protein
MTIDDSFPRMGDDEEAKGSSPDSFLDAISALVFLQNKERPFGIAGVYDHWKNPDSGQVITSCQTCPEGVFCDV